MAVEKRGLLIRGASGSGKSSLALDLIARGARLVSDDITEVVTGAEDLPILSSPGRMQGVIEARGVGLIRVPHLGRAPLTLVVEMDLAETERLPPLRTAQIGHHTVPCLHRVDNPAFPAAIWALMIGGRVA
ncbi:serine kinase [uncultured Maritimibacter sp.]|uniref:HPr kinase/phosphorylase n=1 Tax=uncultured Maritimibacter sp. TaxID=991866 RepID=UPI00262FAE54|nr:serine kinase [uncultured Maritimibacter sp.]